MSISTPKTLAWISVFAGIVMLALFPTQHPEILLTPAGVPYYGHWGVAGWLLYADWRLRSKK